jgi:hypothetical protein
MSWSSWGLAAFADDASKASVLSEGCRVFTLAVADLVFARCLLPRDPADYECSVCALEFSLPSPRRAA